MKYETNTIFFFCIIWLILFNLFDLILTWQWLKGGFAIESNPVMNAFAGSLVNFALVKMLLVTAGCLVLWNGRDKLIGQIGVGFCCGVYAGVCMYHLLAVVWMVFFY